MLKMIDLLGGRIVKTGVAVFLTALICFWLNWPPVFAVITAIVTLEPTVTDSIKKGVVRFPASVIGSGYAVILISLFGNSTITYTLAAVLTIATCFKLNLHAGLLVATLTAVTMVEVIESNYLLAFLTRLGTTSIGLLVSTGVNMFVFPPDYRKDIVGNIQSIAKQMGINLKKTFANILERTKDGTKVSETTLDKLSRDIHKTEVLIRFQNDESKYHPLVGTEKRQFLKAEAQLTPLKMLHYHLNNLNQMPLHTVSWTDSERDLIMNAVHDLGDGLQQQSLYDPEKHERQLKMLTAIFWENNEEITKDNEIHPTAFPPELIILYELVAIYQLVDNFYEEIHSETEKEIVTSGEESEG